MTWATDRLDQIIAGKAEPPPVVRTLKLGLLDAWGEGWIRKIWRPSPDLANADGSMFGGYLAALADQALAFAAMTVVGETQAYRTINLQLNFVRVTSMVPLTIEARVVAVTKQVITVRAEFRREDGALVAEATAQQFLITFPGVTPPASASTPPGPSGSCGPVRPRPSVRRPAGRRWRRRAVRRGRR